MHMIMIAAGRNRLRAQNGCLVLTCALLNSVHSPGIGQFEMANYVPLRLYGSPSCLFTFGLPLDCLVTSRLRNARASVQCVLRALAGQTTFDNHLDGLH